MHSLDAVLLADIGGLFLLPIGLFALVFWVWMVVDCARHETGSTMLVWLLAILFAGIVAAPLYFLLRRLARQRNARFHLPSNLYQPWQKGRRIEQV